ncbi:hypothetical protein M0E87_09995 [Corynebacterium sp. CCM 9185]|uniref:Uncharacterized protein n=1 Tax=Corynebacterium marambiense TaxID=2765364 RepID=A0ABS0VYQ7_9CORY|nr:hypothetical protein [Corynebacterium marambiense]MBI9001489.1 hypothetical protein [Corynebacterium marambiense]MCK7663988.1 hypothetical protein [Corynebacterium marambiense]MCX7543322.1 hypothetical protein [Corynebacterium marambiense]
MSTYTADGETNTYATPDSLPGFPGFAPSFDCVEHRSTHSHGYIALTAPTDEVLEPARIIAVEGHFLTFALQNTVDRRWTHNAERLRAVADIAVLEPAALTLWSPGRRMLKVAIGDIGFLVDLHQGTQVGRCCRDDDR